MSANRSCDTRHHTRAPRRRWVYEVALWRFVKENARLMPLPGLLYSAISRHDLLVVTSDSLTCSFKLFFPRKNETGIEDNDLPLGASPPSCLLDTFCPQRGGETVKGADLRPGSRKSFAGQENRESSDFFDFRQAETFPGQAGQISRTCG